MDPETQKALLEYLLQMGYLGQQSFQTGGHTVPQGEDGMGPSSDQKRSIDYAQDVNSYLADPILGALVGGGGFDAAAFDPIVQREEVDLPGRRMLNDWYNRRPGTVQQIIAEEIMQGGDQASAYATIANILNGEPTSEEEMQLQQELMASIPQMMVKEEGLGGTTPTLIPGGPDLDKVWQMAGELDKAVTSDPMADEYSDDQMRAWNVTETPSDLTQKFQELGLPNPYERYSTASTMGDNWLSQLPQLGDLQQQVYAQSYATRDNNKAIRELAQNPADNTLLNRLRSDTSGSYAPKDPLTGDGPLEALKRIGTPMSTGSLVSGPQKQQERRSQSLAPQTMQAYRQFVNAQNDVYDTDYVRNHAAVFRANRDGRTPLSDVLSARRAQGMVAGVPLGWAG